MPKTVPIKLLIYGPVFSQPLLFISLPSIAASVRPKFFHRYPLYPLSSPIPFSSFHSLLFHPSPTLPSMPFYPPSLYLPSIPLPSLYLNLFVFLPPYSLLLCLLLFPLTSSFLHLLPFFPSLEERKGDAKKISFSSLYLLLFFHPLLIPLSSSILSILCLPYISFFSLHSLSLHPSFFPSKFSTLYFPSP